MMAFALLPIAACAATHEITAERLVPDYRGIEARVLDDDLVQFQVEMTNALSAQDVLDYARCAVAGYSLKRGYGFARHIRTNTETNDGIWTGDSVFLISRELPRGLRTIDTEVEVAACTDKGIPTV